MALKSVASSVLGGRVGGQNEIDFKVTWNFKFLRKMCVQMKEQIVLFALMSNFMQIYAGLSEKLKFLVRADLATMANGSIVMSQNKNKTILKLIFFSSFRHNL